MSSQEVQTDDRVDLDAIDLEQLNTTHLQEWEAELSADPDLAFQVNADTEQSYNLAFGQALCADMRIAAAPARSVRVLEVGHGYGTGVDVLIHRYKVSESSIVGIETMASHYKSAMERWPAGHWYKVDGHPSSTPDLLDAWIKDQIVFDLIVTRHMMEHVPNPEDFLKRFHALLRTSTRTRMLGSYVQITPPPSRADTEKAHFIRKSSEEWAGMLTDAGFRVVRIVKPNMPSGIDKHEVRLHAFR